MYGRKKEGERIAFGDYTTDRSGGVPEINAIIDRNNHADSPQPGALSSAVTAFIWPLILSNPYIK